MSHEKAHRAEAAVKKKATFAADKKKAAKAANNQKKPWNAKQGKGYILRGGRRVHSGK